MMYVAFHFCKMNGLLAHMTRVIDSILSRSSLAIYNAVP